MTFLENTRSYRRHLRRVEYGDERDPETRIFLQQIAPANHAAQITKPLFIIHGQNDPRVPWTEAIQMRDEIRKAGGTPGSSWPMMRGTGFTGKRTAIIETLL